MSGWTQEALLDAAWGMDDETYNYLQYQIATPDEKEYIDKQESAAFKTASTVVGGLAGPV